MPDDDSLRLSWTDVLKYAWKSIRASWTTLLTGTIAITLLSVVLPWGGAYHFSESGWDQVMGGTAVWSLLAIPVWLLGAGVWHLTRAPVGRARDVLAEQQVRFDGVEQELTTALYELERERAAAPVFGEAVLPMTVSERLVRLADLPAGLWLSKRVFQNCQIAGPAKVLLAGSHTSRNRFFGVTSSTFVAVANLEDHFPDCVVFHECEISNCELHNLTVIGTAKQIEALKAGISGDVP